MKNLIISLFSCLLLIGCQRIENANVGETSDHTIETVPHVYKYYLENTMSIDENINHYLSLANLKEPKQEPFIVDDHYNVVVFIQVDSKIKEIGKISFELKKLDEVNYDTNQYVKKHRKEGTVLVQNIEDDVITLLCQESEGIPTTAIWYKTLDNKIQTVILEHNGLEDIEGRIH